MKSIYYPDIGSRNDFLVVEVDAADDSTVVLVVGVSVVSKLLSKISVPVVGKLMVISISSSSCAI